MKHIKGGKRNVLFWGSLTFFCVSLSFAAFTNTAAQGADEYTAKLLEGAKKEKEMLLYSSTSGSDIDALLKGFNVKYPFIKTAYVRGNGNQIINRVHTEARGNKHLWDVLLTSGVKTMVLSKLGLFAKHLSPERKYYTEHFKDKDGYWTDVYANRMVIAYNTKLVAPKDIPKSWNDVLDPKWKGKLGMVSGRDHWFAFMVHFWGKEKGLNFMSKLAAQDLKWRQGSTLNSTLLSAGEMPIGLTLYTHTIAELKDTGATVDWVAAEPVFMELHPIALSARAPHSNAGKLFIDYVLSKEGQQMIARFWRIPSRVDVEAKDPSVKCDGKQMVVESPVLIDNWEEYVNLYRKVLVKR